MVVLLVLAQAQNPKLVLSLAVLLTVFKPDGHLGDLPALDSTNVDLLPVKLELDQPPELILVEELSVENFQKPVSALLAPTSTVLDQTVRQDVIVFSTPLLSLTPSPLSNLELVGLVHIPIKPNGPFLVPIELTVPLIVLMDGLLGLIAIADTTLKTDLTPSPKDL